MGKNYRLHSNQSDQFAIEAKQADIAIDFSGDIWGDNADLFGKNRYLNGLVKDRTAQFVNDNTFMLAGSPGPFDSSSAYLPFAREVYQSFRFVTNRDPVSISVLNNAGFDTRNTESCACPAWLFEGDDCGVSPPMLDDSSGPTVGMVVCGWNMVEGPFDRLSRQDSEYQVFVETVEHIVSALDASVVLFSHNNAFVREPQFRLENGRDFQIVNRIAELVSERKKCDMQKVKLVNQPLYPKQMKSMISQFEMLVSGRVHAAVAGLSSSVPSVIIDYGHQPKAHKLRGFAQTAGVEEFVADPARKGDLIKKVDACWKERRRLREHLDSRIPEVRTLSRRNFEIVSELVSPRS